MPVPLETDKDDERKALMQDTTYGSDLPSVLQRVAAQVGDRLLDPSQAVRDPSPLHHGEDTRRLAHRLLREAARNRKKALELLKGDIRRRYPGFRGVPGAPGFLEYDRVRQYLYKMKTAPEQ